MSEDFDVAVVGGGPAGAAAALTAARSGLRVALFEPQTLPIDKPCGEGLMPPGIEGLRSLGLDPLLGEGLTFRRVRFGIPGGGFLEVDLPRPGISIPRPALQEALERQLSREAVTRFHTWARARRVAGGFGLRGAGFDVHARTLIAADGMGGSTADWLRRGRARPGRLRFGIRARFGGTLPGPSVEVHLDRRLEVYLTPLPGGRINAAILLEELPGGIRGTAGLLRWALERMPAAARHLGDLETGPQGRRLDRRPPRRLAADGAFLVGDAGGGVDPILGCGVTIALRSGILAALAAARLAAGAPGGAPEAWYARAYRREASARRRLAGSLRFLARRPSLLGTTARLARLFPGLVRPLVAIVAGPDAPSSTPIPLAP